MWSPHCSVLQAEHCHRSKGTLRNTHGNTHLCLNITRQQCYDNGKAKLAGQQHQSPEEDVGLEVLIQLSVPPPQVDVGVRQGGVTLSSLSQHLI